MNLARVASIPRCWNAHRRPVDPPACAVYGGGKIRRIRAIRQTVWGPGLRLVPDGSKR